MIKPAITHEPRQRLEQSPSELPADIGIGGKIEDACGNSIPETQDQARRVLGRAATEEARAPEVCGRSTDGAALSGVVNVPEVKVR